MSRLLYRLGHACARHHRVVIAVWIVIVIGLAVTAVMLAYAIRLYDSKKTLSIDAFTESKW